MTGVFRRARAGKADLLARTDGELLHILAEALEGVTPVVPLPDCLSDIRDLHLPWPLSAFAEHPRPRQLANKAITPRVVGVYIEPGVPDLPLFYALWCLICRTPVVFIDSPDVRVSAFVSRLPPQLRDCVGSATSESVRPDLPDGLVLVCSRRPTWVHALERGGATRISHRLPPRAVLVVAARVVSPRWAEDLAHGVCAALTGSMPVDCLYLEGAEGGYDALCAALQPLLTRGPPGAPPAMVGEHLAGGGRADFCGSTVLLYDPRSWGSYTRGHPGVLWVKPLPTLEGLYDVLPFGVVDTVGVSGLPSRRLRDFAGLVGQRGVGRVVPIQEAQGVNLWWLPGGRPALDGLITQTALWSLS